MCVRDDSELKKFPDIFLQWNIPMGSAECEAQMAGDGVFPPKKLFGYAPKYALSIWGPALNIFFLILKKFPEKFHPRYVGIVTRIFCTLAVGLGSRHLGLSGKTGFWIQAHWLVWKNCGFWIQAH
jgi:hypothetical protein